MRLIVQSEHPPNNASNARAEGKPSFFVRKKTAISIRNMTFYNQDFHQTACQQAMIVCCICIMLLIKNYFSMSYTCCILLLEIFLEVLYILFNLLFTCMANKFLDM